MLTSLFRKAKAEAEGWQDPGLARLRDDQRRCADLLADLERRWAALEHRTDFGADQQREQVREQLPAAYQARDVLALRITAAEEREAIVTRDLMPLYEQKRGLLAGRLDELSVTVHPPSDEDFLTFVRESRDVEQLRLTVYEVTGQSEYRREFDAVQRLKSAWFDQQQARMRLFDRLLGVGMRHRVSSGEPAWQPTLRRLSELKACLKGVSDAR